VSDPTAIFAKLNESFGKLSNDRNPARISGVDARGGSDAQIVMAFVKGGKIVPVDRAGALQN
jgi:branched-chain amino acid transport system substrate-binding protein